VTDDEIFWGVAMDAETYDVAREVGGGVPGGEAAVIGVQSEGVQLEHRNPKHGSKERACKGRTSEAKREKERETHRDRETDRQTDRQRRGLLPEAQGKREDGHQGKKGKGTGRERGRDGAGRAALDG
jgi:hypothetical protein